MDIHASKKEFEAYSSPNIDCLDGSAWHDWSKHGAIYASKHPKSDIHPAAHHFALAGTFDGSNTYRSKLKAFLQGASNADKLTKKDL